MNMKIVGISVAVLVSLVVLAGVLMPVLDDATPATKTYTNEGLKYALADPESVDTHTIIVTASGVTSDGVIIDGSMLPGDYTLVFGQHSILRYTPTNGRVAFGGTLADGTSGQWTDLRSASSEETLTLTLTGDTLTSVNGETTKTIEDNWAYVSTDGTYVYCVNPYVTKSDRVIGGGVTYSPFSSATIICFEGTIDDIDAGVYRASPAVTLNSVDVQTSPIVTNLVRIDAIVFNCTQSDNEVSATYTYFLAPAEITYENPAYVGDKSADILQVIPVMVILAILLGVVALVIRSRLD